MRMVCPFPQVAHVSWIFRAGSAGATAELLQSEPFFFFAFFGLVFFLFFSVHSIRAKRDAEV